jgi:3-isopropylmalate/(R)-2-methylmalate dehydratase small subunit
MEPLVTLTSRAAVIPDADIDTDIIFPARFLLLTVKKGLGRYAFHDKRIVNGAEVPGFPLAPGATDPARILITGPNFGCGSSREQAVWALHDLGVRVVLAASFGEIFRSNCFKSGVLPITLPQADLNRLQAAGTLTVDLANRRIEAAGLAALTFEVEDWRREALMSGWDDVLILLNTQADAIASFEALRRVAAPWLFPTAP